VTHRTATHCRHAWNADTASGFPVTNSHSVNHSFMKERTSSLRNEHSYRLLFIEITRHDEDLPDFIVCFLLHDAVYGLRPTACR
jgi:hypothetical protein